MTFHVLFNAIMFLGFTILLCDAPYSWWITSTNIHSDFKNGSANITTGVKCITFFI